LEKLLNIKVTHFSESFDETQKKPYYMIVEYRKDYFYFQNKRESERWLAKFKKESTALYKELGIYLSKVYSYHIQLVTILDFAEYQKGVHDLTFYNIRYAKLLKTDLLGTINLGSEVDKLYQTVLFYFIMYHRETKKNTRFQGVNSDILFNLKNLKRLRKEFDVLFESKSGIKKVTTATPELYHRVLKIA
jgi:hypothetical protein